MPDRRRLATIGLLYALIMLYSSTLIGPAGMNFVPRDPAEAFRSFLATQYVDHGSDQRADWIGNLLMLVPFGFLVAGSLWPGRQARRVAAVVVTGAICIGTILAIKYLQLFFPPRTVTLNYIFAQTLGAVIGCASYAIWHAHTAVAADRRDHVWGLVLGLRLYTGALCLFVLMPLDFALNATDLQIQLDRLPGTLLALPGPDRPPVVRLMLIVAGAVAFIPVGMLLTFVGHGVQRVRRGLLSVAWLGLSLTTCLHCLAALVISAYPVLPSILYRTAAIVAGAAALRWLIRQDTDVLQRRLGCWVPWAVVPYLVVVLLANRLLSVHFLPWPEAVAQVYPLGFLPLFDYYIVTKAEAAKNIVGHVALYMPVGVMLWMRYGDGGEARAFVLAATLSLLVELGRYFRPGLQGDINAVVVAGLASLLAVRLMPAARSMVLALQRQSRVNVKPLREAELAQPAGDVEHY